MLILFWLLKRPVKESPAIHLVNTIRSDHSLSNSVVFILTTTGLVSGKFGTGQCLDKGTLTFWLILRFGWLSRLNLVQCKVISLPLTTIYTNCRFPRVDTHVLHLVNPIQSMNESIGSHPHASPILHVHG